MIVVIYYLLSLNLRKLKKELSTAFLTKRTQTEQLIDFSNLHMLDYGDNEKFFELLNL